MIIAAFIASIALVWLIVCLGLYIKAILSAYKGKRGLLFIPATLKVIFTSKWGHDFMGSLVLLLIACTMLPGVTGMMVGLFASLIFSALMEFIHIKNKMNIKYKE